MGLFSLPASSAFLTPRSRNRQRTPSQAGPKFQPQSNLFSSRLGYQKAEKKGLVLLRIDLQIDTSINWPRWHGKRSLLRKRFSPKLKRAENSIRRQFFALFFRSLLC